MAFFFIKTNNDIEDLNIFNHNFLYITYANDTTFLIKNINSATEIMKTIDYFSHFSVLKIYLKNVKPLELVFCKG